MPIDSEVLDVYQTSMQSFFRMTSGFFGCGWNKEGQLGLGHTDDITTPTPIPGSEGVTRWGGDFVTTFGFSDDGLLACGCNADGQCGIGSTERHITTLTPVDLPDDVKGRVDRVICGVSSFFITGRRCFGCGMNETGQLGIGSDKEAISTPTELPVPVDDIIDLPGPVAKVNINSYSVFVQLTHGSWIGRGVYDEHHFIPVPQADLIGGDYLPEWTTVNGDYAEKLNAQEADFDMMFLPEPFTNA